MPSRLSLRQRRMRSRGINDRIARAWGGRVFMGAGIGNRASLSRGSGNAAYQVFSRVPGTVGNSTKFAVVVPAGANAAASVVVTGSLAANNAVVTYNTATGASAGVATSTVNDMIKAVRNDRNAWPVLHVQVPEGSDGTAVIAALAATSLAGAV